MKSSFIPVLLFLLISTTCHAEDVQFSELELRFARTLGALAAANGLLNQTLLNDLNSLVGRVEEDVTFWCRDRFDC